MVCTADDLLAWTDFPKGLRILLLDEDADSSAEIKLKLENMDYIVSLFCNEDDAVAAISDRTDNFHVAIVEVNTENSYGRFKFLEAAKDLPTLMTSNTQCLSTMMKCIALGAVEFLLKPLSDDKLKNLWQHVVHKAFNAGGKDLPQSLKPIDEFKFSMLSPKSENKEKKSNLSVKTEESDHEISASSDKFPAPLTPQLNQGTRLVDDEQTICSTERDNVDQDGESKFAETTSCDIANEVNNIVHNEDDVVDNIVNDEDQGHGVTKTKSDLPNKPKMKDRRERSTNDSYGKKANRKKIKVDWTPQLHQKFVKAVEQLGLDQAIPSRILDIMKVEGLTRHNIASHLQKYRMQHRHILPKEDDRRWHLRRDPSQKSYYPPHRPIIAYPPYHNVTPPNVPIYPAWGHHAGYPPGVQMWGPAYYPPWQPTENWQWQMYPGLRAEAWGRPVMPPPHEPCQLPPQAEEEIDRVVKEAMTKPWLPLPIGLKPPSTDSVLTELTKQGIPPCHVSNPMHHHLRSDTPLVPTWTPKE